MGTSKTGSIAICAQRCVAKSTCKGFLYNAKTKACGLATKWPGKPLKNYVQLVGNGVAHVDCWWKCGRKTGPCKFCNGRGQTIYQGACCRKGFEGPACPEAVKHSYWGRWQHYCYGKPKQVGGMDANARYCLNIRLVMGMGKKKKSFLQTSSFQQNESPSEVPGKEEEASAKDEKEHLSSLLEARGTSTATLEDGSVDLEADDFLSRLRTEKDEHYESRSAPRLDADYSYTTYHYAAVKTALSCGPSAGICLGGGGEEPDPRACWGGIPGTRHLSRAGHDVACLSRTQFPGSCRWRCHPGVAASHPRSWLQRWLGGAAQVGARMTSQL